MFTAFSAVNYILHLTENTIWPNLFFPNFLSPNSPIRCISNIQELVVPAKVSFTCHVHSMKEPAKQKHFFPDFLLLQKF